MLLANNGLLCCCRTLFRASLNCKLQPSTSLFKRFSHCAYSSLPKTSILLSESITIGKPTPKYLSCCSSTAAICSIRGNHATLMDWSHAKRRSHSDPAPHTLNFDVLKSEKFEKDILLYSNNNVKECLVYNVLSLVAFGFMSYAAYKIYAEASLDAVEDERDNLGSLVSRKSMVPFYRYFDLVPYREVLSGTFFLFGCLISAITLRYTLRCVHQLTLLRDGKTIAFTTSNVCGRPVSLRVPVDQAHTEKLNCLMHGHDSCLLHVRGTRVAYHLDTRGKLHEPNLIRQYLGTEKEKDDPLY